MLLPVLYALDILFLEEGLSQVKYGHEDSALQTF